MSSNVVPFEAGAVAKALADFGADSNDDLSAGVRGGYSIISFRGSKWRIKHDGEETLVTNDDGEPMASLRCVIVKANSAVSKNYYEGGWAEGSNDAPDCFSVDGERPDSSVTAPRSTRCADCQYNRFGSRVTESGAKAKACSDSRRIAVIPEGDFLNEVYGGPMLLRIPAGSLTNLATYGKMMKQRGYPYNTVITRVSFDPETSHPKLMFNAIRPLNDEEAQELVGLLNDSAFTDKVNAVLGVDMPMSSHKSEEKQKDADLFEKPPAEEKPKAKTKTKAKPKPEPKPEPQAEAEAEPSNDALDDKLKGILDSLDNLD
jgi:cell division septation protein DedD